MLRHSLESRRWKSDLAIDGRPRIRREGFFLVPYLKVRVHSRDAQGLRAHAYAQTATKTERDRKSDISRRSKKRDKECTRWCMRWIEKFTRIKSVKPVERLGGCNENGRHAQRANQKQKRGRTYTRFYKRGLTLHQCVAMNKHVTCICMQTWCLDPETKKKEQILFLLWRYFVIFLRKPQQLRSSKTGNTSPINAATFLE